MPRLEALLGCSPRLYPGLATAMPDRYRDFIALILGPLLQVRETKSVRLSNWLWRRESLYAYQDPGCPRLGIAPNSISGLPMCWSWNPFLLQRELRRLPSQRVHSRFGIPKLIQPSLNQSYCPTESCLGLQVPSTS